MMSQVAEIPSNYMYVNAIVYCRFYYLPMNTLQQNKGPGIEHDLQGFPGDFGQMSNPLNCMHVSLVKQQL